MKSKSILVVVIAVILASSVLADTFGTGDNQFTIDFVNISGDASSANGTNISHDPPGGGDYRTFTDPSNDYRIGTYEITNDQWNKFTNIYGTPIGIPSSAYDESSLWTGTDVPTNELSWYEGAQFVNYLNTSTGHQVAYKFTGAQGTGDYTLGVWESDDAGYDASNPFRNSNAYYFLPTEDEWVKAAYWNGTNLQTHATKSGQSLTQGNGTSGTGWNYWVHGNGYATNPVGPWAVGSGSQELNGTYDMMGNVREWLESPYTTAGGSARGIRGGAYNDNINGIGLSGRTKSGRDLEDFSVGFRVASVPEPATLLLLGLGTVMARRKLVG